MSSRREKRGTPIGDPFFDYCADKPTVVGLRTTGGGFHLPVSASDFGLYRRMVRLKPPFGAGSQLASLSFPGLSFWKYRSSEPSALYLNGIQLLTAKRPSTLLTWNPSGSYSVIDQNAFTGGAAPFSNVRVYLFEPSSGLPDSSPRLRG